MLDFKKANNDVVLVVDTNLGLEHARRIGDDGYDVYYSVVHAEPYPKLEDEICGLGFEEVKKVWDWGEGLENGANIVIFTDSGFGGLANWLRNEGYYVFGADAISERLELDRVYVRRVLKRLGISVPPADVVKGINSVVKVIEKSGGKKRYVKVSRFRGGVETFGTNDPYEAEILLKQGGFSIVGDDAWFVVEQSLEGMVEIGTDTWFNGEGFQPIVAETIEMKGAGNVTKFVRYEDSVWYDVLEKLKPYLSKNGYRGMFCLEGFYDGNTIYVTDVTPRFPYICSYAYPKIIENYSDLIIGTAKGRFVVPRIKFRYSAQIGVYTDNPDSWRIIRYNRDDDEWIAYRRVIKKGDNIWFVPGDYVVAVGISESYRLRKAIELATERAEAVSTSSIYTQGRELMAYIDEVREKLSDLGYDF